MDNTVMRVGSPYGNQRVYLYVKSSKPRFTDVETEGK